MRKPTIVHLERNHSERLLLEHFLEKQGIGYIGTTSFDHFKSLVNPKIEFYVINTQIETSQRDPELVPYSYVLWHLNTRGQLGRTVMYSSNENIEEMSKTEGIVGYNKLRVTAPTLAQILAFGIHSQKPQS
jgi:hypothetical protein